MAKDRRELDHFLVGVQSFSVPIDHRLNSERVTQVMDSWPNAMFLIAEASEARWPERPRRSYDAPRSR